ncbi:DNA-binding transcriptional regulator, LysR family [Sphingobium faniae]|nr:DNA-binding transcriptional regulator, LysR family [Sphingobium faniae]
MKPFEWGDLLFFLELVRTGSPSAAGKKLKVDHTTVRRRISALEDGLRARLFTVKSGPQQLTEEGERLLAYAESMETLILRAVEEVADRDLAISGTVRVGVPEGFGTRFLAARLAGFCAANPELDVKLMVLPRALNMSNREADIAIDFGMPHQQRKIARKLMDYQVSIYASPAYLDGAPPLEAIGDISEHRLVGYIDELNNDSKNTLEAAFTDCPRIGFASTSIEAQKEAIKAGYGIGILPDFLVTNDDGLVKPLPKEMSARKEFWMIMQPEMINLARVRTVIDFIVEEVRKDRDIFISDDDI